jgi:[ribosomal protein S18]-alanine N-acetyltransferase
MIFGFRRARPPLMIRLAQSRDASDICDIHTTSFDRAWGLTEFERMLSEETSLAHVAGEERSGRLGAFVLSRIAADEAEILSIAVRPDRRGEGHSARLLLAHHDVLALNGVKTVFLEVETGNAPALALYKRQGYAEVARRDAYYKRSDGSAATALVMRKALS